MLCKDRTSMPTSPPRQITMFRLWQSHTLRLPHAQASTWKDRHTTFSPASHQTPHAYRNLPTDSPLRTAQNMTSALTQHHHPRYIVASPARHGRSLQDQNKVRHDAQAQSGNTPLNLVVERRSQPIGTRYAASLDHGVAVVTRKDFSPLTSPIDPGSGMCFRRRDRETQLLNDLQRTV